MEALLTPVLGILSVMVLSGLDRLILFSEAPDAKMGRFYKRSFKVYAVLAMAYHCSYFILIGFSSWLSVVPVISLVLFVAGFISMKRAEPDVSFDPANNSFTPSLPTVLSVLITFFFVTFLFAFPNGV